MSKLSQQYLRDVLFYDRETGEFRWRKSPTNSIPSGSKAGSTDRHGYTLIRVGGERHQASRLAFLWMAGVWPAHDCDHRDGNPGNNAWENLRQATTQQNLQSKRVQANNKARLKGVTTHKPNRWRARIKTPSRSIDLGVYDCPVAAHLAYALAAETHFGTFARY